MIYLDYNATTPIDVNVLEAMLPFLKDFYGNPSALYRSGRIAHSAINTAREQIAALVDAPPSHVVFTSGGTEANHLALASLPRQGRLAISTIEHPSITEPAIRLKNTGNVLDLIDVDNNGVITSLAINEVIKNKPDLVSIMLANNTSFGENPAVVSATRCAFNVTVQSQNLRP